MKIDILVRSLGRGGAERQLVLLARQLAKRGHRVRVLTFYGGGPLEVELAGTGVALVDLLKGGRWDVLPFLVRLVRQLRWARPDALLSYLTVPNLVGLAVRGAVPEAPLIWGVRSAGLDLRPFGTLIRSVFRLEPALSPWCDAVIFNSRAGLQHGLSAGFPSERAHIILNGIDTDAFARDQEGRVQWRLALGTMPGQILVGLVARFDPTKGHEVFLKAAAEAASMDSRLRFVCVGDLGPKGLSHLETMAGCLGLEGRIRFVPGQRHLAGIYSALDLLVSASNSEGFSNVIAEAMACGTPCLVTDVGDSRSIVGRAGRVVPPNDPGALSNMLLSILKDDLGELGRAARQRVESTYSPDVLASSTEEIIHTCIHIRRRN